MFTIYLQNHLPQLNGNKYISIFALCILLSACALFQPAKTPVAVVEEKEENTAVEQEEIIAVTDTVPADEDTVVTDAIADEITDAKWNKRHSYNIALILPFSIDAEELYYLMENDNVTAFQPLAAISFYEGALQALDTLRSMQVNLQVFTFDIAKDSSAMLQLIHSGSLDSMDVLIGPVFNECLIPAARFAKEHEIFLISPLSPSPSITDDNPFYILMNPTLGTQLQALANGLKSNHTAVNTVIICRPDMPLEQKLAADFKQALMENPQNPYAKNISVATSIEALHDSLRTGSENFIFIASLDELFVNQVLRNLSLASRNDLISVSGLGSILNFETVSLDYLESLHFHFPESYYIDPLAPRTLRFKNDFIARYNAAPDEYAARGFDITLYAGYLLYANGPDIRRGFDLAKPTQYLLAPIQLKAVTDGGDWVEYYENRGVTVLKLSNYRFEKVYD